MEEQKRAITGYEGLYEISASGRIYSVKRGNFRHRCGDEYGFHIVKLSKNRKAQNCSVFGLWKKAFPEAPEAEFKGALKAIYK